MILKKELGAMLYWAEGDKTKNYFVALTNTDINILTYYLKWLRKYYDINETRLKGRLHIWNNINEQKPKEFWSKKLKIPIKQFTKSYISKSILNIKKQRHEFGVCRISYGSVKIFQDIKKTIQKKFTE